MKLSVLHRTTYAYEHAFRHAVMCLRLTPAETGGQTVKNWGICMPGIDSAVTYRDSFGNLVHVVTPPGPVADLEVTAGGTIETRDGHGVAGPAVEVFLPDLYLRQTPATRLSPEILAMAESVRSEDRLQMLHDLLAKIHAHVKYDTDATHVGTTAAEAFASGSGVCQDHAHIFITAARALGVPARYVTGYLHLDTGDDVAGAHHAWAEALADGLGWVGFDAANGICPTAAYVRLAIGLDAKGAAPIRGVSLGSGGQSLAVAVAVRQAQQ